MTEQAGSPSALGEQSPRSPGAGRLHDDTARAGLLILAGMGAPNHMHRLHSTTTLTGHPRPARRPIASELPCQRHDPGLWFAEAPADLERAKALCTECPIRLACLAVAIHRGEYAGVWGGHIFERGRIVARKRSRGRPRQRDRAVAATTHVAPAQEQHMITSIASAPHTTSQDRVHAAATRLYGAECALHAAHQSHVDAWIDAANRKLHDAVHEYLTAVAARRTQPRG